MSEQKPFCPSHPNPLCPMKEGKGRCDLCGYDFSGQKLDRESRNAFWEQSKQEGESKKTEEAERRFAELNVQQLEAEEQQLINEAELKKQQQVRLAKEDVAQEAEERRRQEEAKARSKEQLPQEQ